MHTTALRSARRAEYAQLPGKYQRSDVIRIVTAIAPDIGLSTAALRTLITMISTVPPNHWTSDAQDAVCYRSQRKIAHDSALTSRSIRSHEAQLERLGLIYKTTAANGARGSYGHGGIVQGLSFNPLIERFHELLELEAKRSNQTKEAEVLTRKCSAARRAHNRALGLLVTANPHSTSIAEALRHKASWPRRYEGMSVNDLTQLLDDLNICVHKLSEELDLLQETSAAAEEIFLPYIHATTDTHIESCSTSSADERTDRKRSEPNIQEGPPKVGQKCEETRKFDMAERGHKPDWTETFSPSTIYRLASEDFRMYLDAERGTRPLNAHHIVQAANAYFWELRIDHSVWDQATETMGDIATALALLVIDANRTHPIKPIRSPGATLRTFTRLAEAGRLNLHGSLIGLKSRADQTRTDELR